MSPRDEDDLECEKNVARSIQNSFMVKLMIRSLDKAGCPVNPGRHFVCEKCSQLVDGGYDVKHNQVVICSNRCKTQSKVEEILNHELVHMYDFCTASVDFNDLNHLACTEVRAANLVHCKLGHIFSDDHDFSMKRETCVKKRAAKSVSVIRGLPFQTALEIVNGVFQKCSKDLEPIGRKTWNKNCEKLAKNDLTLSEKVNRR